VSRRTRERLDIANWREMRSRGNRHGSDVVGLRRMDVVKLKMEVGDDLKADKNDFEISRI